MMGVPVRARPPQQMFSHPRFLISARLISLLPQLLDCRWEGCWPPKQALPRPLRKCCILQH